MRIVPIRTTVRHALRLVCVALPAWGIGGCTTAPPPNGNGGNGKDGVVATIVAPTTSFGISVLEDPITVFYSVLGATGDVDVSGYYVPLDSNEQGECADPDGSAVGDRVILVTRELDGDLDFFNFDPGAAGIGCYRFGILVSVDGVELDPVDGDAAVEVQAPPNPRFVLPETDLIVLPDAQVLIKIDAGDPQNQVEWRLFLLSESDSLIVPADQLGTELLTGAGNVGEFVLSVAELDPGTYEIGISATDTGDSISATVDAGLGGRIVTIPSLDQTGRFVTVVESLN